MIVVIKLYGMVVLALSERTQGVLGYGLRPRTKDVRMHYYVYSSLPYCMNHTVRGGWMHLRSWKIGRC